VVSRIGWPHEKRFWGYVSEKVPEGSCLRPVWVACWLQAVSVSSQRFVKGPTRCSFFWQPASNMRQRRQQGASSVGQMPGNIAGKSTVPSDLKSADGNTEKINARLR